MDVLNSSGKFNVSAVTNFMGFSDGSSSNLMFDHTITKPDFQSSREGALSGLPVKTLGSAYQRLHDPQFSQTRAHEMMDAQLPAPVIGHRSGRSAAQSDLASQDTNGVDDSSDIPLDRQRKQFSYTGSSEGNWIEEQKNAIDRLRAATLANEPNWFNQSIRKPTTQTQSWVVQLFSFLDESTKLESLKQETLFLFQKKFKPDVGADFYSTLIGMLTPPEQQHYLMWLAYEIQDFPDAQKDDALKGITQSALRNNILPAIFNVISDADKDKVWGLATQNLEQKFNLKDTVTLAKVVGQLPIEQRTNACHTLARIAFSNNISRKIFDNLRALKSLGGDPLFNAFDLLELFSEEAKKLGKLSDIAGLVGEIKPPPPQRKQRLCTVI